MTSRVSPRRSPSTSPPRRSFRAITDVRGWWSGEIDGTTDAAGRGVHVPVPGRPLLPAEDHRAGPGEDRGLACRGRAILNFVEDPDEWTGTDIRFDISPRDGGTEVRFTHVGLDPDVQCFDGCSSAWTFYINGSLRDLITTGTGEPNDRETTDVAGSAARSRVGHRDLAGRPPARPTTSERGRHRGPCGPGRGSVADGRAGMTGRDARPSADGSEAGGRGDGAHDVLHPRLVATDQHVAVLAVADPVGAARSMPKSRRGRRRGPARRDRRSRPASRRRHRPGRGPSSRAGVGSGGGRRRGGCRSPRPRPTSPPG